MRIPSEYWDEDAKRYNSHRYFKTINHHHMSDYSGDNACDLMIVECSDGQWYIEDNWGGDAQGDKSVFNPHDKHSYPTFFPSMEEAEHRAAVVISSITGTDITELLS